jgi:hypothetical protein
MPSERVVKVACSTRGLQQGQFSVASSLWSERVKEAQTHRLAAQYGYNCLLQLSVYEWIELFKSCRTCTVGGHDAYPHPQTKHVDFCAPGVASGTSFCITALVCRITKINNETELEIHGIKVKISAA